jgi:hypothetical protein
MKDLDIEKVAWQLEAAIRKARREAIAYTLLTVLCTPGFVVLACLAATVLMAWLFRGRWYDLDAMAFYTGLNLFLASMLATVMAGAGFLKALQVDKMWFAAAVVFLLLLVVTYATSLMERAPVLFGIGYALGGFLVLGLLGRAEPRGPVNDGLDGRDCVPGTAVAVATLIVSAYGELLSASWLWVPPKPHEVRIAARVLCRLAAKENDPLSSSTVEDRVTTLLSRLKLIEVTQQQLHLTSKGQSLVQAAMKECHDGQA